jgi:hypothetical protein
MAVSAELFKAWVQSKGGDEGTTLGSIFLGEDVSMLNADRRARLGVSSTRPRARR